MILNLVFLLVYFLAPGVNFTNVLQAALWEDPKSPKNTVMSSVFFTLLGSTRIKAASKLLMK
jgi:hypothetical protein